MPLNNLPPASDAPPRLDGVAVELNGKEYILPPCSFATLKRWGAKIAALQNLSAEAAMDPGELVVVIMVTFEALRRNYPSVTLEEVEEGIGLDQMNHFLMAAMDVSGVMRKDAHRVSGAPPEDGELGESTGTTSAHTL